MAKSFWGSLSSNNTEYRTIDNQLITQVMYDLDKDFEYYSTNNEKFFSSLTATTTSPSMLFKYYDSGVQRYVEGGRPNNELVEYEFPQECGFQLNQAALTITSMAARMMTAEELAAIVQAKLTGFQQAKFQAVQQAIFFNTPRTYVDGDKKRTITQLPFFNGDLSEVYPIPQLTLTTEDAQHYNAVSTANVISPLEVRKLLVDKVRKKGFRTIEIWMNDYDYYLENTSADFKELFIPAESQIGRKVDVQTGSLPMTPRLMNLSPWEGLIGYIYQCPVIKTPMCPAGYMVAVGIDGGSSRAPFVSRLSAIEGLNGLQLEVRNPAFPLEHTIMTDSWGYAAHDRGAVAVVKVNGTSYQVPPNL